MDVTDVSWEPLKLLPKTLANADEVVRGGNEVVAQRRLQFLKSSGS